MVLTVRCSVCGKKLKEKPVGDLTPQTLKLYKERLKQDGELISHSYCKPCLKGVIDENVDD